MYGWRGRIGLLVPSLNTTNEMDFHFMAPEGVSIHTSRFRFVREEIKDFPEVTSSLEHMDVGEVERAAQEVADSRVHVIAYGCTSGSFVRGIRWDKELALLIEKKTGIPAVTTSMAALEALEELGINKVAVITPYPDEINDKLRVFLEGNDFQVVSLESFKISDMWKHAELTPQQIYALAKESDVPEAEGIFIACTQLRAVEVAEMLERDLNKPVVTAVQALMWACLKRLKIRGFAKGFGTLMTKL